MRGKKRPKPEPPPDDHVTGKSGRFIPAWKQAALSAARIDQSLEPKWRDDPTYNLRRKKR